MIEVSDAAHWLARFFEHDAHNVADIAAVNKVATIQFAAYLPLSLLRRFHYFKNAVRQLLSLWLTLHQTATFVIEY